VRVQNSGRTSGGTCGIIAGSCSSCRARELRTASGRCPAPSWCRVGLGAAPHRRAARDAAWPPGARTREPASAAAARRRPPRPPAPAAPAARPGVLGAGPPPVRGLAPAPRAGAAGDGAPLAPARLAAFLVVALPETNGATTAAAGGPRPDPSALGREPAVGHGAHPGRACGRARPHADRWRRPAAERCVACAGATAAYTSLDVMRGRLRSRRQICAASGPRPSKPCTTALVRRPDRSSFRHDEPRPEHRPPHPETGCARWTGFCPPTRRYASPPGRSGRAYRRTLRSVARRRPRGGRPVTTDRRAGATWRRADGPAAAGGAGGGGPRPPAALVWPIDRRGAAIRFADCTP
jgi:hypothetical protein